MWINTQKGHRIRVPLSRSLIYTPRSCSCGRDAPGSRSPRLAVGLAHHPVTVRVVVGVRYTKITHSYPV